MTVCRPHGRVRFSPSSPTASGVCDRCGIRYAYSDLVPQYDYRGTQLADLRILVCKRTCNDVPQNQLRPIIIPPDPYPVINPRVEQYATEDAGMTVGASVTPPSFGPPIIGGV